jgi:hypothetical protein
MPSERVTRAQVLVVDDCPNADRTVERLRQALDQHGATDVEIELLVVEPGTRPPDGFAGSPTVLLDGSDPFASTAVARTYDVACRAYPPDGHEHGAPSLHALQRAVSRH